MKLNEIVQFVKESVRFGSKEIQELMRFQDRFKIGIEYEFHIETADLEEINERTSERLEEIIDELIDHSAVEQMIKKAGEGIGHISVGELAKNIHLVQAAFENNEELDEDVKEAINDELEDNVYFINEDAYDSFDAVDDVYRKLDDPRLRESFDGLLEVDFEEIRNLLNDIKQPYAIIDTEDFNEFDSFRTVQSYIQKVNNIISALKKISNKDESIIIHELRDEITSRYWDEAREYAIDNSDGIPGDKAEYISGPIYDHFSSDEIDNIDEESGNVVEVITAPLNIEDAIDVMERMFDFINDHGYTSEQTGMHINISYTGADFTPENVDPLKVMLLVDEEFISSKFQPREHVDRLFNYFQSKALLRAFGEAYMQRGFRGLEQEVRKTIPRDIKNHAISFATLGHYSTSRIEFRFPGGSNYHRYPAAAEWHIQRLCYMVLILFEDEFLYDEYKKDLIRFLDQVSQEVVGKDFSEVIGDLRNFDRIIDSR